MRCPHIGLNTEPQAVQQGLRRGRCVQAGSRAPVSTEFRQMAPESIGSSGWTPTQAATTPSTLRRSQGATRAVPSPVARFYAAAFTRMSRVLDIGAGSGRDLAQFLDDRFDPFGVEPSAGFGLLP